MAKGLKRRRISKQKKAGTLRSAMGRHYILCTDCQLEELSVDKDVSAVTCAYCVQKVVLPPKPPKQPLSDEEKKVRAERKMERVRRKAAKAAGLPVPEYKDLGFTKGWQLRTLFTADDKYYSKGKEITKKQHDKLAKEKEVRDAAKLARPKFGRGWHFKAHFVASDGIVYSYGKPVKGAKRTKRLPVKGRGPKVRKKGIKPPTPGIVREAVTHITNRSVKKAVKKGSRA